MILNDKTIRDYLDKGVIHIEPFEDSQVQSSSVDLRLGYDFLIYPDNLEILDVRDPYFSNLLIREESTDEGFIIKPKQFILATTLEYLKLPDFITAFVEGRSSLGRLGLFIENAGWVDAGFEGNITLEFYNANSIPIKIYPRMRICQLVFAQMVNPSEKPYRGKYQGQKGATASRIYMDRD